MRVPCNSRSGQLAFNMTPMIDVVFLLIIFFLLSSHLAKQEAQMELPLPVAEGGEVAGVSRTRRLTLNVLEDGRLLLSGHRLHRDQLEARLVEAAGRRDDEVEIRIRSDRRVRYGQIEPLLLACARAGIWNISFGVIRPEEAF